MYLSSWDSCRPVGVSAKWPLVFVDFRPSSTFSTPENILFPSILAVTVFGELILCVNNKSLAGGRADMLPLGPGCARSACCPGTRCVRAHAGTCSYVDQTVFRWFRTEALSAFLGWYPTPVPVVLNLGDRTKTQGVRPQKNQRTLWQSFRALASSGACILP